MIWLKAASARNSQCIRSPELHLLSSASHSFCPAGSLLQAAMQEAPTLDVTLTQRMLAAVEVRTRRGRQPGTRLLAAEPRDSSWVGLPLLQMSAPFSPLFCSFVPPAGPPCLLICMLPAIKLQAAVKEDRFVLFVAAPEYDEIYVSLNRRSQPYNRLVSGPRVRAEGCVPWQVSMCSAGRQ